MKALERALWFLLGGVVGFLFCLALALGAYFGLKRTPQNAAPGIPPRPIVVQPSARFDPLPGVEIGRQFGNLGEVIEHYQRQDFVMLGQFPRSGWPASITAVHESTNEITFRTQGSTHRYPGYNGFRLKAVTLADANGRETTVVLRSKGKVAEN